MKSKGVWPTFKLTWRWADGYRRGIVLAGALMIVGTILSLAWPMVLGLTLNGITMRAAGEPVIGTEAYLSDNLWLAGLLTVSFTAVGGALMFFKARLIAVASENIAQNLRMRLFDHLQRIPCPWHDNARTGDTVQRCTSDIDTFRTFLASQVPEILKAIVLLAAVLPIMFVVDWRMALMATVMLPFIAPFTVLFFFMVRKSFKAMDEAEGAMTANIQENLTGIRVVRAFARQDHEIKRFIAKSTDYRDKDYRMYSLMALFWCIGDFMTFVQMAVVLFGGAYLLQLTPANGGIEVGTLVTFIAYMHSYLWPIRQSGRLLSEMGRATVAADRINEILEVEGERESAEVEVLKRDQLPEPTGGVRFNNVTFGYGENADVLHDVSFEVHPGHTLALLGPSGSGKSTLLYLLMRYYNLRSGNIELDGVDIRQFPLHDLRQRFGVVLQEPFLYSKTIGDNIKLARVDADPAHVRHAAQMAAIDESVQRFPKQYDTIVGERGVTLSGGQRQRVAIARALLRDAPVLLLDDALSAVDTNTETLILNALRQRRGKQTTIVIAHRLTTLKHADDIIVLEKGAITQRGTHQSLVDQPGLYRKLWEIQTALEQDLQQYREQTQGQAAGAGQA